MFLKHFPFGPALKNKAVVSLPSVACFSWFDTQLALYKRHDIYYGDTTVAMVAVNCFKNKGKAKVVAVDGSKKH